jgi:hypothetical protein
MDRLEGELGPDDITRQRAQARCRHRKPQHCAATVGDMNIAARARPGRRKAAPVKRMPRISDGNRLDHLRFRIAPQGIKM